MELFKLSPRLFLLLASIFGLFASNILSSPLPSSVNRTHVETQNGTATLLSPDRREAALKSSTAFPLLSDEETSKTSHSIKRRSIDLETRDNGLVQRYAAGGRTTYNKVDSVIDDVPDNDQEEITVTQHWNVDRPKTELSRLVQYALASLGIDTSSGNFKEVDATLKSNTQIFFKNAYGPKVGVLVASNNQAFQNGQRLAPNSWYQVAWSLWTEQCNAENESPSNLKYVIRETITNDVTGQLLDEITEGTGGQGNDASGNPFVSHWTSDDDAFYALLQSPNGLGVSKILEKYPNNVGYKQVSSIFAFYEPNWEVWTMWFELEEC